MSTIKEPKYRPHSARSSRSGRGGIFGPPKNYGDGSYGSHVKVPTGGNTVSLSRTDEETLLKYAVKVSQPLGGPEHEKPPLKPFTRKVTRVVELPFEEDNRVPVKRHAVTRGTEKRMVTTKKMVPVKKWKEVQEEEIEVHEEEVTEWIEEWKLVRTPVTRIVKKPKKVLKTKRIPYTEFEEREVEV